MESLSSCEFSLCFSIHCHVGVELVISIHLFFPLEIDFVLLLGLMFDQVKLRSLFFSSLAMLGSGLYAEIGTFISSRECIPA